MLHPGTCNASMLTPQEKCHLSAQKTLQAQEVGGSFNTCQRFMSLGGGVAGSCGDKAHILGIPKAFYL